MRLFARHDRPAVVEDAPAEQAGTNGATASDAPTSHWAPKLEPLRPGGAVGEVLSAGEGFEEMPFGGFGGVFQTPGPPPAPTPWEISELPDPEWVDAPRFGDKTFATEPVSALDAAKLDEAEQSGEVYDPPPPKIFTEPPPPPAEDHFEWEKPDWREVEREGAERDARAAGRAEREAEEQALARMLSRAKGEKP